MMMKMQATITKTKTMKKVKEYVAVEVLETSTVVLLVML